MQFYHNIIPIQKFLDEYIIQGECVGIQLPDKRNDYYSVWWFQVTLAVMQNILNNSYSQLINFS